ncbi:YciI family protein [Arthrobacter sp. H20]|uniref:YciI family protein n=1 Tax=Arthrobacter sp. H20 TaxID=1267981 RepID=UPI0004B89DF8|nr:YciI family protein [Arthrobacter sp. H20]
MSTEYIILLHDNELDWQEATAGQRAETYGRHTEFSRRCAEDGHRVTGGAELQPSTTATILRGGSVGITDGPYTETVEQLGGFYLVETDNRGTLAKLVNELLADTAGPAEIRATMRPSEGS